MCDWFIHVIMYSYNLIQLCGLLQAFWILRFFFKMAAIVGICLFTKWLPWWVNCKWGGGSLSPSLSLGYFLLPHFAFFSCIFFHFDSKCWAATFQYFFYFLTTNVTFLEIKIKLCLMSASYHYSVLWGAGLDKN